MATKAEMSADRSTLYFHFLSMKDKYKHSTEQSIVVNEALGLISASMTEPDIAWVEKKYAEAFKGQM